MEEDGPYSYHPHMPSAVSIFNDVVGPYFKAGIYRASAREPMAVRFRGIRIGTLPQ